MENASNFSWNFRNIEYQWILVTSCLCRYYSVCCCCRPNRTAWHSWHCRGDHTRVFWGLHGKFTIHRIVFVPRSSDATWTQPQIPYLKYSFQNWEFHVVLSTTEKNNFVPTKTKSALLTWEQMIATTNKAKQTKPIKQQIRILLLHIIYIVLFTVADQRQMNHMRYVRQSVRYTIEIIFSKYSSVCGALFKTHDAICVERVCVYFHLLSQIPFDSRVANLWTHELFYFYLRHSATQNIEKLFY